VWGGNREKLDWKGEKICYHSPKSERGRQKQLWVSRRTNRDKKAPHYLLGAPPRIQTMRSRSEKKTSFLLFFGGDGLDVEKKKGARV